MSKQGKKHKTGGRLPEQLAQGVVYVVLSDGVSGADEKPGGKKAKSGKNGKSGKKSGKGSKKASKKALKRVKKQLRAELRYEMERRLSEEYREWLVLMANQPREAPAPTASPERAAGTAPAASPWGPRTEQQWEAVAPWLADDYLVGDVGARPAPASARATDALSAQSFAISAPLHMADAPASPPSRARAWDAAAPGGAVPSAAATAEAPAASSPPVASSPLAASSPPVAHVARSLLDERAACEPGEKERAVLAYLAEHPDATQEEVSGALYIARSTVADYTSSLQAKGLLRREGSRRSGRWIVCGPGRMQRPVRQFR